MSDYVFRIEKEEDGYCFRLYPNNRRDLPIGTSAVYPSLRECEQALEDFRLLVKSTPPMAQDSIVTIEKYDELRYIFKFKNADNQIVFFREHPYWEKAGCKHGIQCIFENIDADIDYGK